MESAIRKLWSSDDKIRLRGRNELLQMRSAAVGPLVGLLTGLIRDPNPKFPPELEGQGQNAIEIYIKQATAALESGQDLFEYLSEKITSEFEDSTTRP